MPLDKIAFYGTGWQIYAEISQPISSGLSVAVRQLRQLSDGSKRGEHVPALDGPLED
jgi:hypothetical protein